MKLHVFGVNEHPGGQLPEGSIFLCASNKVDPPDLIDFLQTAKLKI